MNKKDYLKMLNSIEQGEPTAKPKQHERVIFIDGLNLFLRNFAVLNFINSSGTHICLLYTSPSPRDRQKSRMPSSA